MLIDTHTHLYQPEFGDESTAAIERAFEAGIGHMIFPNVDCSTVEPMKRLHSLYPDSTSMAMGLHPTEVNDQADEAMARIEAEFRSATDQYVAVGEIGIDLYWDKTFAERQMQVLEQQMQWARLAGLPVIIHCRDGLDQTLEVLQAFPDARGVMHSFGGTEADVDKVRRTVDFYFGINGIVTFKNSKLRDVLPAIGTERLLLETDSPYLAPVPNRGKRNESAYLVHTTQHVAQHLGLDPDRLADITTANARTLFRLNG